MFLLNRGRRLAFDLLKYMSIFCLNILSLSKLIGLKIALIWLILNRNGHSSWGFFPSDFTHRNFAARIPWSRFDRQNELFGFFLFSLSSITLSNKLLHPFLGPRIHVRNRYGVTGPLSSGWSQNFHFRLTLIIFKSERFPINREAWKSDRSPGTKNDARPKLIAELIPRLLLQFYCAKNMASNLDNRFIPSHSPALGIRVMYICFTWINYNIHFHVIKIMGIKFTRIRNSLSVRMVRSSCLSTSSKAGFEMRHLVH